MKQSFWKLAITGALALGSSQVAWSQNSLAIKGGKIIPVVGEPMTDGTILIRDGKIAAIGKDVKVPLEALVLDAKGKVIMPGYIEVHTSRGMDQTNERNPNIPYATVLDSIDPSQDYFAECRRNGVTSVAVCPGDITMIGGQCAVIKTAGKYIDDMVMKRFAGLKISMRPAQGRSRMSQIAALRAEFDSVKEFLEKQKEKKDEPASSSASSAPATPPAGTPPGAPPAQGAPSNEPKPEEFIRLKDGIIRALKGEGVTFVYCDTPASVATAVKFIADYKLKGVLVLAPACYKAAKLVAESKLPVVLDPQLVFWENDPKSGDDNQIVVPRFYTEQKVPLTFTVTGPASNSLFFMAPLNPTLGSNFLWYQAATAVKYGLPANDAVESITIRPAKVLGIEKAVGSIEVGKEADLQILTGEPLKMETWVDTTIIQGKVVYERAKDERIKQLLEAPKK